MEEEEFEQGLEVVKRGIDERILLEAVCQHIIRVTHKLQQLIHRRIRSVRIWYWSLANRVPNIRGKPWKLQIERNEKVEVFSRLFNVQEAYTMYQGTIKCCRHSNWNSLSCHKFTLLKEKYSCQEIDYVIQGDSLPMHFPLYPFMSCNNLAGNSRLRMIRTNSTSAQ